MNPTAISDAIFRLLAGVKRQPVIGHRRRWRSKSVVDAAVVQLLEPRTLLAAVTSVSPLGLGITGGSGSLNEGDSLTFTVNFDVAVNVNRTNGSPTLRLSDGGTATYSSGSGTTGINFVYSVAAGRNADDLAVSNLLLNGSSIRDLSGVAASLAGAVTNPTGTLRVDTWQPIVQSINRKSPAGSTTNASALTWTLTVSEAVTGVDLADFQVATTGTVSYSQLQITPVSSSTYDITAQNVTGDGTIGLNLVDNGSIRDQAGNSLTTLNSIISFQSQQLVTVGQAPVPIAMTDLNRDGKLDVVTSNHTDNSIGVRLGLGDGTFQAQQAFSAGTGPISVAAGDVNGDGSIDVVAANENGASVSVLLGNGDGTLQMQQTYSTDSIPSIVVLGDLNGDGKLDIVTSNLNSTAAITLLLGNGDGTFQQKQSINLGALAASVAIDDLNGDNKLDLVVSGYDNNVVRVLIGNGDSTFQTPLSFAVGSQPRSVAVGDVNGDAKADVIVSNVDAHTMSLLLGNGDGTLQPQQILPTGTNPMTARIADLNGDRKPDLLSANFNSSPLSVLRGNGDGTFQTQQGFGNATNARGVSVGDLNGDGRPDVVIANQLQNNLGVLLNNSRGSFTGQVYNIGIRLLTPVSSTTSLRPTFTWTPAAGATSYEIHINNESTGVARFHLATVTGTTYTPNVDLAIGRFKLWIRPNVGTTAGKWTPPFNFSIAAMPSWKSISRVQLTSNPTLEWNALPGAVKYDLWIDNQSTGQKQVVRLDVTGTTWTPVSELPMGLYRSWIRGIDANGNAGSWSSLQELLIVPAPVSIGPLSATFDRTPTFNWTPISGAALYELYVRNLTTNEMVINGVSVASTSFTPASNLSDGQYRWWTIAVSAPGIGPIKSGGSNSNVIFVGGRPTFVSPVSGSTSSDRTPTISWTAVDGAASYRLQVNRIDVLQYNVINQTGLTTTNFTPVTNLSPGTYRAWVRAVSSTGELSPWSLQLDFTLTAII